MKHYLVITMDNCQWCDRVKERLRDAGHAVHEINMIEVPAMTDVMVAIGRTTVPQVFELVGNHDETVATLDSRT